LIGLPALAPPGRVSISPWADKRISAEALGPDLIFACQPNPATLAPVEFDPEWVRRGVRETVAIAKRHGCVLETMIKGTHTGNHRPWRLDEWCGIAMEGAQQSG